MKKRILSVFLTLVMVTGVAVLPSSDFMLIAEAASTAETHDNGMVLFNREYPSSFGTERIAQQYTLDMPLDGDLRLQINVPRNNVGAPAERALPINGAFIQLARTGTYNSSGELIPVAKDANDEHLPENILIPGTTQVGALQQEYPRAFSGAIAYTPGSPLNDTYLRPLPNSLNALPAGTYEVLITRIEGVQGADTGEFIFFAEYFNNELEGGGKGVNDTFEGAQLLVPGMTVRGRISVGRQNIPNNPCGATGTPPNFQMCPPANDCSICVEAYEEVGDTDMYKYELTEPGRLTFYITGGHVSTHTQRLPIPIQGIPNGGMNLLLFDGREEGTPSSLGSKIPHLFSSATATSLLSSDTPLSVSWHTIRIPSSAPNLTHIANAQMSYVDLEPGTYYIRLASVLSQHGVNHGTYSMRADFMPFDESKNADSIIGSQTDRLDDNVRADAREVNIHTDLPAEKRTVAGFLSLDNAVDIYKIVLEEPGVVYVDLTRDAPRDTGTVSAANPFGPSPGDGGIDTAPNLRWLNNQGDLAARSAILDVSSPVAWLSPTFNDRNHRISGTGDNLGITFNLPVTVADTTIANRRHSSFVGLEAGTYYVEVERRGISTNATSPHANLGINSPNTGTYSLTFEFLPANRTKDCVFIKCSDKKCITKPGDFCTHTEECDCCPDCVRGCGAALFADCHEDCEFDDFNYNAGNTYFSPVPMEFGQTARGMISTANNIDTFLYVIEKPGIISLEIYSPVNGGLPPNTVRNSYSFNAVNFLISCYTDCDVNCDPNIRNICDDDECGQNCPICNVWCRKCNNTTNIHEAYITNGGISFDNNRIHPNFYAAEPGIYKLQVTRRDTHNTLTNDHRIQGQINNGNTGLYNFKANFNPIDIDCCIEPNNNCVLCKPDCSECEGEEPGEGEEPCEECAPDPKRRYSLEPNNNRALGTLIFDYNNPENPNAFNRRITTMLSLTDHEDIYQFVVSEPGRVSVNITSLNIPLTTDPVADLIWYREGTVDLEVIRRPVPINFSASGQNFHMDFEIPGTYYVGVHKRTIQNLNPPPEHTHTSAHSGFYTINAGFTAAGNMERNNNTMSTAEQIGPGQMALGYLSHQDTVDWFKYTLPHDANLTMQLTNGGSVGGINFGIGLNNLSLAWYSESGVQLGIINTGSIFDQTVPLAAGSYFFEVTRRTPVNVAPPNLLGDTTISGTYILRVSDNVQPIPTITGVNIIPENDCCPHPRDFHKKAQFIANVTGTGNFSESVIWSIDGAVGDPRTRITAGGVLEVHQFETRDTLTIRATSTFNPSRTSTHTINLQDKDEERDSHYITLEIEPGEGGVIGGTVFGGGWHLEGCETTITATAGADYTFAGWYEDNDLVSADAVYTFDVEEGRTFEARFVERTTVEAIIVSPKETPVQTGQSFKFSAVVEGENNPDQSAVVWSISDETCEFTKIDPNTGELFVGITEPEGTIITVTATSTREPAIFDTATVTVTTEPVERTVTAVTVTPNEINLSRGSTRTFVATVDGIYAPQNVIWTVAGTPVDGATQGTGISSTTGLLTIGASDTRNTITVRATSTHPATPPVFGEATVTILQPRTLVSIVQPAARTGVLNGTPKTATALGLPLTVTMNTTGAPAQAVVMWRVDDSVNYNPGTTTAQTFRVEGTVLLPEDVLNPDNNVSLEVFIDVTVNGGIFTITFNPNQGSVSVTSATTGAGGVLTSLPTPTRSNHTFNGWFTALTGGTQVSAGVTVFTADTTIYARWTASGNQGNPPGGSNPPGGGSNEARTITFNLQGGNINGATANFTRTTQDSGVLATGQRPSNPIRAGYTFDGWFTAASGGSERDIATFAFSANTTLYAQWIPLPNQTQAGRTPMAGFTITQAQINTINSAIPVHQLSISVTGSFTLNAGTAVAGQLAVLVRYNSTTREFEFVAGETVGSNGNAVLNITAAGDYLALIFKTGDVTGTGTVDTGDALAVLRHVAGVSGAKLNSIQNYVANGKTSDTNTGDALNILRLVAGVINRIQ
ncbi:MAG: InlB B-repeat-containing protein [Oscillospiraceae bacterium]|jgi:uncharacterized repeat protein (TIGR02543 family)|nr:InlB B-repeat-containing protein [Oscillospiraceae bacterium]